MTVTVQVENVSRDVLGIALPSIRSNNRNTRRSWRRTSVSNALRSPPTSVRRDPDRIIGHHTRPRRAAAKNSLGVSCPISRLMGHGRRTRAIRPADDRRAPRSGVSPLAATSRSFRRACSRAARPRSSFRDRSPYTVVQRETSGSHGDQRYLTPSRVRPNSICTLPRQSLWRTTSILRAGRCADLRPSAWRCRRDARSPAPSASYRPRSGVAGDIVTRPRATHSRSVALAGHIDRRRVPSHRRESVGEHARAPPSLLRAGPAHAPRQSIDGGRTLTQQLPRVP